MSRDASSPASSHAPSRPRACLRGCSQRVDPDSVRRAVSPGVRRVCLRPRASLHLQVRVFDLMSDRHVSMLARRPCYFLCVTRRLGPAAPRIVRPLSDLCLRTLLEWRRHRKYGAHIAHCRDERRAIGQRTPNYVHATPREPARSVIARLTHHRTHRRTTLKQRISDSAALPTRGTQTKIGCQVIPHILSLPRHRQLPLLNHCVGPGADSRARRGHSLALRNPHTYRQGGRSRRKPALRARSQWLYRFESHGAA
jgi:hypothetical protein